MEDYQTGFSYTEEYCMCLMESNSPVCDGNNIFLDTKRKLHFEETMEALAAAEYCEFKNCPGCHTCVEREDLDNLNVHCTVCSAVRGRAFQVCWQCLRVWKGPCPRSDRCGNDGCTNKDLKLLKRCITWTPAPSICLELTPADQLLLPALQQRGGPQSGSHPLLEEELSTARALCFEN
ncbi:hypothetical protein JZ751_012494 [Albula glossodonta]|uniref:Uncharacterized protein n=1 Tax=Albula glossodonta TaxID=121402 RepID=A0A8T2P331_9TELE|nr:hypothetical protein JZ751_012494 [Albula glossodonta]